MSNAFASNDVAQKTFRAGTKWLAPTYLWVSERQIMGRDKAQHVALSAIDATKLCGADANSIVEHCANTGSRSPGELEMTLSTSDVAVCCSSDCRSSLSNRAFSMAMTACAAKFLTNSICLPV